MTFFSSEDNCTRYNHVLISISALSDAKTPLTCAVRSQSLPCVELLIKDGAKVTTNHKEILYDPDHALSLSPLAASVKLKHR